MSESNFEQIADRVAALDDRPVAEHPKALEDIHAEIVAELEQINNVTHRGR